MRDNLNKIIKVTKKDGEEYHMFITGKMLSFYLLVFNMSYREKINPTTYELHAFGQTKAVRFFCDKNELKNLMCEKEKKNGRDTM